ncbi:prepilin peptidase [Phenylobacterium sp.]|uniref:A24 family peptidase n=1 Tax=Phenylobacterium sp. TaxID=1871053 RepID=UPI0011F9366E|nr:prepilin peptidase [Phenylobacterium sp.]THD60469.1 MAG: pilus assembly protein CpaA [Phenylobacterium sp.]
MIHTLQTLPLLAFPVLVIWAAVRDATSYTIPNWIPLALAGAFPVAAVALGLPLPAAGLDLAVGAAALIAGMVLFALRWIGGGDAKLLAAAALWLGLGPSLTFLLVTAIAGGALTGGLLALRSATLRPFVPQGPGWFARLASPGEGVPYGVAIALGALAAFPDSALAGRI